MGFQSSRVLIFLLLVCQSEKNAVPTLIDSSPSSLWNSLKCTGQEGMRQKWKTYCCCIENLLFAVQEVLFHLRSNWKSAKTIPTHPVLLEHRSANRFQSILYRQECFFRIWIFYASRRFTLCNDFQLPNFLPRHLKSNAWIHYCSMFCSWHVIFFRNMTEIQKITQHFHASP